jgi:predicted SnoaL-like aldol condensation-catalyzing enzyme
MTRRYDAEERANLALIEGLYANVLNALDPDRVDDYIAEDYIQHNQQFLSGREPLKTLIRQIRRDNPQSVHDIKRILVDGNMVAVHYHARRFPEDPGWVTVDLFRIENGKVVEHWDVLQDIDPDRVNPNPPV